MLCKPILDGDYSRFHIDRPKFKIYTYRRTLGELQTLGSRESSSVAPPKIVLPQPYLTAGAYICSLSKFWLRLTELLYVYF